MMRCSPDPSDPAERLRALKRAWLRGEFSTRAFCELWRTLAMQQRTWRWN